MQAYIHKVQYYETDKMGVTHHSNYIRFMEEARTDFLEKIGYPFLRMESEGIASPVIGVAMEYKKPTTYADEIEIEVQVENFSGVRCCFAYVMKCHGEVVCMATSQHCFLNTQGRPISLKRNFPELCALLESLKKGSENGNS